MNNHFHTRLIDLKVELSRIPQNTVAALGEALSGNRTISDIVELVKVSSQDLGKFRGEADELRKKVDRFELRASSTEAQLTTLEALPEQVSKLALEHAQLAASFKCLVGLVLLDDLLAHWSDEYSDSQKERINKAWHAVDEPVRGFIATLSASDEPESQKAWQELRQELPNLQHQKDRVGHLRAAVRKLRWALLRRS